MQFLYSVLQHKYLLVFADFLLIININGFLKKGKFAIEYSSKFIPELHFHHTAFSLVPNT